nr:DUF2628 domain-containing protein [uncultured Cohaesibacter sp.]
MASYTIYEKPGLSLNQATESAVIVKNQYSVLAFFLPALWMVFKRLWWVLLGYILFMIPLWSLYGILPLWSEMLISLLISVWISVEAPNLIGWHLERKGYEEAVTLFAEDKNHCEYRYIEAKLARADADGESPSVSSHKEPSDRLFDRKGKSRFFAPSKPSERSVNGPVIGLFPTPNSPQETK